MRAQDQYHVGTVVDDFDGALEWWTKTLGYRWCEELNVENVLVGPDGQRATVPLRFTYSMDEPHLELVQSVPGTFFVPCPASPHHVGYWSDDIDVDLSVLESAGAAVHGRGYWPDGRGPLWAFATPPLGPRIELVHRSSQPSMQRWWATGRMG